MAFGVVDGIAAGLTGPDADLGYGGAGGQGPVVVGRHVGDRDDLQLGYFTEFAGLRKPGSAEPIMITPPLSSSSSPCLRVPSLR